MWCCSARHQRPRPSTVRSTLRSAALRWAVASCARVHYRRCRRSTLCRSLTVRQRTNSARRRSTWRRACDGCRGCCASMLSSCRRCCARGSTCSIGRCPSALCRRMAPATTAAPTQQQPWCAPTRCCSSAWAAWAHSSLDRSRCARTSSASPCRAARYRFRPPRTIAPTAARRPLARWCCSTRPICTSTPSAMPSCTRSAHAQTQAHRSSYHHCPPRTASTLLQCCLRCGCTLSATCSRRC
jgi:hypothetical protein